MGKEHEQAIAAIAEKVRANRPKTSRTMWIAAAVIGVICSIAFVLILVADPDPKASTPSRVPERGSGFSSGLAIGIAVGIAIGFSIARQRNR